MFVLDSWECEGYWYIFGFCRYSIINILYDKEEGRNVKIPTDFNLKKFFIIIYYILIFIKTDKKVGGLKIIASKRAYKVFLILSKIFVPAC